MRVLIVKIGAIGDVVMALRMVSAARAIDPNARITWVVGRTAKPILQLVTGIDQVLTVDDERLLRGGFLGRALEVGKLWSRLIGRSFDIVATGHADWRYRALSAVAFAGARRSFGHGPRRAPIPGRYHGGEYARLISGLDGPGAPLARFPDLARTLPEPPLADAPRGKIVVLAPGGARNVLRDDPLRRWPLESYVSLAAHLCERGYAVLLTGGQGDADVSPSFASIPVLDLIGRTTLQELASILRAASLVVTHDSLALHLGVLAGAKVLALFGPTCPSEKAPDTGARGGGEVRVLWGGARLACRPCYDGVNFHSCRSNVCLQEISVQEVLSTAEQMLG